VPAAAHMQQTVRSNYLLTAVDRKNREKVLESAFAEMTDDEEHVVSGLSSSGERLPYICTTRGLYFGEMRKDGLFKKVPVHVFISRDQVQRAELVQMRGYAFTSLRGYAADGSQIIGMSFDELGGNDLSGEAQARRIAEALGIKLE
jgi:hypothetical protein